MPIRAPALLNGSQYQLADVILRLRCS